MQENEKKDDAMSEHRLSDVIPVNLTPEQLKDRIRDIGRAFTRSTDWVRTNRPRTERNLILFNLLAAAVPYIELCVQNISGLIAVLALCSRTLFELNMQTRYALKSESNLRAWHAEAGFDRIGVLNGMRELREPDDPRVGLLVGEIARTRELVAKHGLQGLPKWPNRIESLAIAVGLEREYKSLFKLFSKLVHPTSYWVNATAVLDEAQTRTIMLACFQLYALDLLKRLADALEVPVDLISPSENTVPESKSL
jgi:hypothetical protein